jgi:SP family arabinose:H+ symporter-like MFS transporter
MNMNKRFVLVVNGVAALGGLLFGFDTAVISGAIPYITPYFHLESYLLGWVVSCVLAGCVGGAMLAGKLADRRGRRTVLFFCAVLFAGSGLGAGLSHQVDVFILFRTLGGLGVGAAAMVSPMYIAETAPDNVRGRLVSLYQLAIVLGILLAYFANYCFKDIGPDNWRWMFASQVLPSLLFAILLCFVPETPRWLVLKGRREQALKVLSGIAGEKHSETALLDIETSFAEMDKASLKDLFSPRYRKVLTVGIFIAVFQQITGINAILYYAPIIFKETGMDTSSSLFQTIGIGLVNVIATGFAIALVDKVGRKKFLLAGSLLMGLSLAVVGICFYGHYFGHYIVLVAMLIYVASFGCTLGAVTWVYLSEIFPNRIRGYALSVATICLWLADLLIAATFPILTLRLGTAMTFWVYTACCAAAFLYTWRNVQETKGQSLENIELLFTSKSNAHAS